MIAMKLNRSHKNLDSHIVQHRNFGQCNLATSSVPRAVSLVLNLCRKQQPGDEFENLHMAWPAFPRYGGVCSRHVPRHAKSEYLLLCRPTPYLLPERAGLPGGLAIIKLSVDSRISAYRSPKRLRQMMRYLSPMEIALWACTAAGQILPAVLLLRCDGLSRYPAFCLYIIYGTLKRYLLLYIAASFSAMSYFWMYYPTSLLGCLLMAPLVLEIFPKIYGSSRGLPTATLRKLRRRLFACAGGALQIGRGAITLYRTLATVKRMPISAVLVSLLVLLPYSPKLGFSGQTRIAGVAVGFVLFQSFNVISLFLQANKWPEVARIFRGSGQLSCLLVFIYWCWRFRKHEPVVQLSTRQSQSIKDELMRVTQDSPQGIRT
jgi:hypothetical protein